VNAKQKAYLARVAAAAGSASQSSSAHVDATLELSEQALVAMTGELDRMPASVFRELTEKGYLVAGRRGFAFSPKADAYRSARRKRNSSASKLKAA
jgi:hypothetical protein